MWKSFNPNPAGNRTIDCAVRALCFALDVSWDLAYFWLTATAFELKTMPSAKPVIGRILASCGWVKRVIPDQCPQCYTAEDFCRDHPFDKFVLAFDDHIATVINGDVYDTWDSRGEVPLFYWRKE